MRRLLCFLTLASVAPGAHAFPRPLALATGVRKLETPGKAKSSDPELARRLFTPVRRCAARRVWHGFDLPKPPPPRNKRRVGLAPMSPWAGGSGVKVKIPI
jgi:hypothetical protein